jgi:hypothetical protein
MRLTQRPDWFLTRTTEFRPEPFLDTAPGTRLTFRSAYVPKLSAHHLSTLDRFGPLALRQRFVSWRNPLVNEFIFESIQLALLCVQLVGIPVLLLFALIDELRFP